VKHEGQTVWLCQPRTFMNLSGEAVGPMIQYYRVPLTRVMVVVDDADLPLGSIRMRVHGSSGGHHGLESLEQGIGGKRFGRQRIGIGRGAAAKRELAGYVLAGFEPDERSLFERVVMRATDQLECWLTDGVRMAMDRFNGVEKNAEA
jgi:PTH1 family peptidyl-tRNA hydrolase